MKVQNMENDELAVKNKALLLAARWFKLNFDCQDGTPPSKADLAGMFDAMLEARLAAMPAQPQTIVYHEAKDSYCPSVFSSEPAQPPTIPLNIQCAIFALLGVIDSIRDDKSGVPKDWGDLLIRMADRLDNALNTHPVTVD